jgi:hypothetical protein
VSLGHREDLIHYPYLYSCGAVGMVMVPTSKLIVGHMKDQVSLVNKDLKH